MLDKRWRYSIKTIVDNMKKTKNDVVRVLQIGMHDKIGGIETFLMNYYRNLDRNKIQFDFICPYHSLCFESEIKKMGGVIYYIPNFKKHPIKYYKEIKRIIKDKNYKIVHINLLSAANIIPAIVAKRCKVKNIIAHSHNNGVPSGFLRKILNNTNKVLLRKCANIFFACSESSGKWMFYKKTFSVIKNGIDIEKYYYNDNFRKNIRNKYGISDDKIVIGQVGRFDEQKNHMFSIELLKKMNDKKYILFLIGEGILESEIKKKVVESKLSDNVIFAGIKSDVEKYYSAFDIFLLPSKFEGLGIVNIEAQASGLPCVVSSIVPTETKVSANIYYLDLNNIKQWENLIIGISAKKNHRNVRSKELSYYDIKKLSKELEEKYLNMYYKEIS